jgi:hypothetical protein
MVYGSAMKSGDIRSNRALLRETGKPGQKLVERA